MQYLSTLVKHAVSQNRNRFVDGQYDLDLTYITNRIIAMGFPGDGVRGLYRNNGAKVSQFLRQYHDGHYMIFNLSQLEYEKDKFDNNVMLMGWPDHHNPPLDLLFSICKTMHAWLAADEKNVVVIHCLAGKGRTGTLIVSYLLYIGMFTQISEALEYFAMKRTNSKNVDNENFACVDSPSQVTYVEYFHKIITKLVDHDAIINSKPIVLKTLYLHSLPSYLISQIESGRFQITIYQMSSLGPNDVRLVPLLYLKRPDGFIDKSVLAYSVGLTVHTDIVVVGKVLNALSSETIFRFAFHTAFIENYSLRKRKSDMDDAWKNSMIGKDFLVDLTFEPKRQRQSASTTPLSPSVVDLDQTDATNDIEIVANESPVTPVSSDVTLKRELYTRRVPSTAQNKKVIMLSNHQILELMDQNEIQVSMNSKLDDPDYIVVDLEPTVQ